MKILFVIIIPILISLIIFFAIYRPAETIEYRNSNYLFKSYSDESDGGKSIVSTQIVDKNLLELTYTLSDNISYPTISLEFSKPDYKIMDFSGYDYMELGVKSKLSKFLGLQLYIFIDGYSNKSNYETYLPLGYYLEMGNEESIYTIPLKEFKPHTWWLTSNQISEDVVKNYSFDSVVSMDIMNDPSFSTGVEDQITFSYITFYTSIRKIISIILSVLGLYYLAYFVSALITNRFEKVKQNREEVILVPYKSSELPKEDSDESVIESYICSNYTDQLLNVGKVEDETGVSERVISKILKEKYNYSFPGFINFLRITEAKKLLLNSDKKILDVAMMVGYNSLGHFNRTFKKHENSTPREYRKMNIPG